MKNILKTNWFMAIISLLCAVLIWVYVVYQINPMFDMKVRKLPIKYVYQSADFETGKLMILSTSNETADIKIRGKRSSISKFKRDDIKCSVDMSDVYSTGKFTLPLNIEFNADGIELISKEPYVVNIEVDDVITVEKDIEIDVKGKPESGFIAESVEYSPLKIRLTGARSIVNKVKTASISVDLSGATDTLAGRYKIMLYDKNGEQFSDERINCNVNYTELKYNIFQKKDIEIKAELSDEFNISGEKISVAKIKPEKVSVLGDKRALLNLDSIETEKIDVSHIRNGDTISVSLKPLPDNSKSEEDIKQVEVTFKTIQK